MNTTSISNTNGWRGHLWLGLLVAAGVAFSLGLACAAPLAAFAAGTAISLSRRDAMLVTAGVWLANQIVGFGFLDYPWTANALAWGLAMGIVALVATQVAFETARRAASTAASAIVVPVAALVSAFLAYELGLFVVAAFALGGIEAFAPSVVMEMFATNGIAMAGLVLLNRLRAVAFSDGEGVSAGRHA